MTPGLSVIVLNYNGRGWLEPCLQALERQSGAPPFEVLLADNGSEDGSVDLVATRFPFVRLILNRRNLGFAAGNNAAARAARGELLVFLNNDTVPAPDWLARLHAAHRAGAGALITSRIVLLDRPDVVDSAGDGYLRAGGAFKHGHGASSAGFVESREVFGACGAAFLVPRETFERLGGFDESFFMVYEDVDLSYRARLAGYRCWYAADAVVCHAGSGTLGVASDTAVYYGQRNLEWTWIKNTPGVLLMRTLPSHVAYSFAGLIHYARIGRGRAALRAKLDALKQLPAVLRSRRRIQSEFAGGADAIEPWLERGWLARKRTEKSARLDLPDHQHWRVR